MKAYAKKQNQAHQQASPDSARSNARPLAANRIAHPSMHLQRTVGNQAVQRLLRAGTEGLNSPVLQRQAASKGDPAAKTVEPSPRALMLLDVFTKNRSSFKRVHESDFRTESKDKDASVESIRVKEGGIYWTLKFVTNNKTGVIYVRQSQDGTDVVNWYQGVLSKETAPAEECDTKAWAKEFDFLSTKKPTPPGNIESSFVMTHWIWLVKQIQSRSCPPKEIQVSVTLFIKTASTVPADNIAVKNLGLNVKEFLEARLPKSIKITEAHEVLDLGKSSSEYVLQAKVILVY